jgi:exosortase
MSKSPPPLNLPHRLGDKVLGFCWGPLGVTLVFVLVVLWSNWTTLAAMVDRWSRDPQYSHGFLVPIFALMVLWFRGDRLNTLTWEPSFLGLPLLLAGALLRLYAIRRDIAPLDAFALLPTLFGLVLLVGGRSVLRWSWPALAFLGFMIPLPFFLEGALALPLQHVATAMSTYLLQTFGYPAIAEGNVILIDQVRLGVVEACSGLKMLTTFFALSTALALISTAPLGTRSRWSSAPCRSP